MIEVEKSETRCLFRWTEPALDATNCQTLKDRVKAEAEPEKALVINLAALEFVDSSGIGALISAQKLRGPDHDKVILEGVGKPVLEVLEMLHLQNVFAFA